MIPRTFPSIIEALQTKMVVYVLPSITGLTAWIDYIPVKGVTTESNALANTYATDGYQVVKTIDSLTGKQAWLDYIPVFESASYNKPWSTDAGGYIPAGGLFSIASLFANGEQGTWYDPSDLTTLFQDSAGTTPVTAVQQPVGRMLDKSGRGNHAFQTTSASRPVLSARYNLLTKTEQFEHSDWSKGNTTITANSITAPDGSTTADLMVENTSNDVHWVAQNIASSATGYAQSVCMKAGTRSWSYFRLRTTGNIDRFAYFNLADGTIGTVNTGLTASIQSLGDGWYRCTATISVAVAGVLPVIVAMTTANNVSFYQGNGTSGIFIWGADLRVSNDALGQPAYQRVNTATDYDTVGFKPYLAFDGVDDSLVTNSIDFTATDKMTVFAGVRKLSDAARGMLIELSATTASNNGAFAMTAPDAASATYAFESDGTILTSAVGTPFTAPLTSVLTGVGDISGDVTTLRVNGTQAATSTADQGTGNYGNYPLFIGRRNQATLPLNGRLYSLIVRGAASTTAQITSTETYVNQKTGAY